MFGYVTINPSSLPEEKRQRFNACYCGLCHMLGKRYGLSARLALSYDMTFLSMLLSSLYEPEEDAFRAHCPSRPWKKMAMVESEAAAYAADMNIAFAYFKAMDDASDEKSAGARALAAALRPRYRRVEGLYPEKCAIFQKCIAELSAMEKAGEQRPDLPANAMGTLFGEVYAWKDDFWHEPLHALGEAIGRYIYLSDAYEDRIADEKKKRYNALASYASRPDYEEFVRRALTMIISEGADAFETLPLARDVAILRNVLYSGVWARYSALQAKQSNEMSGPSRRKLRFSKKAIGIHSNPRKEKSNS